MKQFLSVLSFVFIAVVIGGWFWWTHRTYHLAAVQTNVLYRSGNRGEAEFSNGIAKDHVKSVVSVIDDNELNDPKKPQFMREIADMNQKGVKEFRIPVKLGGWPTSQDIGKFLAIVANPANRPVLVHCAQGVRRTGMFVAAYQESVLGYDPAKAKGAIQSFGHSGKTIDDIQKFIDTYNPTTHTVATTLPITTNE